MDACILCGKGALKVTLRAPTRGMRILLINGGGTRGIIPLEHLAVLQHALGQSCPVAELFNLSFGISSGK